MKGVCCFSLLVPRVYLPAWCHRTGQEFMHLRFFVSVVLLLWFPGASGSLSSQVDEDSKAQDKQWLENDFIICYQLPIVCCHIFGFFGSLARLVIPTETRGAQQKREKVSPKVCCA